jgi:hypothetical protein
MSMPILLEGSAGSILRTEHSMKILSTVNTTPVGTKFPRRRAFSKNKIRSSPLRRGPSSPIPSGSPSMKNRRGGEAPTTASTNLEKKLETAKIAPLILAKSKTLFPGTPEITVGIVEQ